MKLANEARNTSVGHSTDIFVTCKRHGQPDAPPAPLHTSPTAATSAAVRNHGSRAVNNPSANAASRIRKFLTGLFKRKPAYTVNLPTPHRRKPALSAFIQKTNFISPAPSSAEEDVLKNLIHNYHNAKASLDLYYRELSKIQRGKRADQVHIPVLLVNAKHKIEYLHKQITKLKNIEYAQKIQMMAYREKIRQGAGCYENEEKFEEIIQKDMWLWNNVNREIMLYYFK